MDIQKELKQVFFKIEKELNYVKSAEEQAILLVAKANVLIALQKYEGGNK